MRGQRTFQSLFVDVEVIELPVKERKGRCSELDSRRNELLLIRYMWYGLNKKDRYEIILSTLENEFFISQRRISDIITQNSSKLRELKPGFPESKELSMRYPHLKWA